MALHWRDLTARGNQQEARARVGGIVMWLRSPGPWPRRALALLLGALATLGHAPVQFAPAFAIALASLVWLVDADAAAPRRVFAAFGTGWWFGAGYFAVGLHWIAAPFLAGPAALGPWWGAAAVVALASLLAVFWAAGCALAVTFWTRDARRICALAAALGAAEWLRGNALTGFPWLLPAYVWTPGEAVSQFAAVGGIYLLSVLSLFWAAAPALLADVRRHRRALAAATFTLAAVWTWGALRLASAQEAPPGPIVRVADAGLSQADKWRRLPDQEWRVLDHYLRASALDQGDADIVVWPEGAVPVVNFYPLEHGAFMRALSEGMEGRTLIFGVTRRDLRAGTPAHFNSLAVLETGGAQARVGALYDKIHLVPFGEYIPFHDLLSGWNVAPLQQLGVGFEPGRTASLIQPPGAPAALPLICYEAIFPDAGPAQRVRPAWLVMVSNDSWFGGGAGPLQHFAIARYRAIEMGLPAARAASGGVSGIVDAYGRVVASMSGRAGFVEAPLPAALPETGFARWGQWPFVIVLLLMLAFPLLPWLCAVAPKRSSANWLAWFGVRRRQGCPEGSEGVREAGRNEPGASGGAHHRIEAHHDRQDDHH